jgi:CheY-like chemotaxis protein
MMKRNLSFFGGPSHMRYNDRGRDSQSTEPTDRTSVREWCSHLQLETNFASEPVPVSIGKPTGCGLKQYRIMIADDDHLVRASLAAVLESEGYIVDEASNGRDAVACVVAEAPDLVLLDLNMPHWDGWTAFAQLDRLTPLLPVIVITARPNQYQKAVRLGVDAFMEKPLNIPVLVNAVKRLASEDKKRRLRHITDPSFVTELLGSASS